MKPYRGPPATLGSTAAAEARVIVWCDACGHRTEPDAEVLPNFRFVRAVTRSGDTITGRLLNQDTFTVQLLDSAEHLRSLSRTALREFTILNNSPMPSYRDKLTSQELADLVGYLASLKAEVNP